MATGVYFYVVTYIVTWGAAWVVLYLIAPTVLVSTSDGLQTMLQVIPAVIVSVFVLVLGSLFVIAQQATTAHGTRAPLALTFSYSVRGLVIRPLLIAIAALALSGQVPLAANDPTPAVCAAVTILALATAQILVSSATLLPALLQQYTAPMNFVGIVVEDVEAHLRNAWTGLVVFRVGLLGEMLRASIRRGDSVGAGAALLGLRRFHDAYTRASRENPAARVHVYDDGSSVTGWLGDPLRDALVDAAQDALVHSAPEEDLDAIIETLGSLASNAIAAHQSEETHELITGVVQIGTASHQLTADTHNYVPRPAQVLAVLEALAEQEALDQLAEDALVSWAMVVTYPTTQFDREHPFTDSSVSRFGISPPFDAAIARVGSPEFSERWSSKLREGPRLVIKSLERARRTHLALTSPSSSIPVRRSKRSRSQRRPLL